MKTPRNILMVGLPASGKTTVARKLAAEQGLLLLSSDEVREKLWGDAAFHGPWEAVWDEMLAQARAAGGQKVVVDATNMLAEWRHAAMEGLTPIVGPEWTAVWLDTPVEECLRRNREREKQMPDAAIYVMALQMENPRESEGFEVVKVEG